jgi:hypothetical protein
MKTWHRNISLGIALLFLALGFTSPAGATSSSGDVIPDAEGWVSQRGGNVLVIQTGGPIQNSINRALNELAVLFDFFQGSDFSGVDFSPYDHVILGMDGGLVGGPSMQHLAEWARLGGCAHIYGGTCIFEYAQALNLYFLENDQNNWCWTIVGGVPDVTITNASHYLATGLPATYNFVDVGASFYQTRSTDGALQVAARNGDGYNMLGSKPFLAGNFDICINSAQDVYYSNPTDYNWLKQVVANMLTCGAATAVEPTTWGQIKSIY